MKTHQVNMRLEAELIAEIERSAAEESLDRGTMIRRLLLTGLAGWRTDRAVRIYQQGGASLERAATDARISLYEMLDLVRARGVAYPFDAGDAIRRLDAATRALAPPRVAEAPATGYEPATSARATLPDRAPRPGGILMVGINPAVTSARAGHYYQGRLGRRLWRRLERLGLLRDAMPGAEDDAFVAAGHGLTDLVKRATRSAGEVSRRELLEGAADLRRRIMDWKPGLVLFVFKVAARFATGASLPPGPGPLIEGVPTFLLTGPYAAAADRHRNDDQLLRIRAATGGAVRPD